MPPVAKTYGARKKKRLGIPKCIFKEGTGDPFEALNINRIKESKPLLDAKRKKSRKRPLVINASLGCSRHGGDTTFDRLLEEPSHFVASRRSPSVTSGTFSNGGSVLNVTSTSDASISSFHASISESSPKHRKIRFNSTRDIYLNRSVIKTPNLDEIFPNVKTNDASHSFSVSGCERGDSVSSEFSLQKNFVLDSSQFHGSYSKLALKPISPIYPLTSTPSEKVKRNDFDALQESASELYDSSKVKNETNVPEIGNNVSMDLFSPLKSVNMNENADASVDLFSSCDKSCILSNSVSFKHDTGSLVIVSEKSGCQPCFDVSNSNCSIDVNESRSGQGNANCLPFNDMNSLTSSLNSGMENSVCDNQSNFTSPPFSQQVCGGGQSNHKLDSSLPSLFCDEVPLRDCKIVLQRCDDPSFEPSVLQGLSTAKFVESQDVSAESGKVLENTVSSAVVKKKIPMKSECHVALTRCDDFRKSCISASGHGLPIHVTKRDSSISSKVTVDGNVKQPPNDFSIPIDQCEGNSLGVIPQSRHGKGDLLPMNCIGEGTCDCVNLRNCEERTQNCCKKVMDSKMLETPAESCSQELTDHRLSQTSKKRPSLDPVVLRPGKHWRRSLSIMCKVRKSGGEREPSLEARQSLTLAVRPKGKLWESTVNSLLKLQSASEVIPEDLEATLGSLSLNSTVGWSDVQPNHEDSVLFCGVTYGESPESSASLVYRRCNQQGPIPFQNIFPSEMKKYCKKIGEGVYGEVFFFSGYAKRPSSVIKIIPVEGLFEVNGEPQKSFGEICSEMVVAQELSSLRGGSVHASTTFNEVLAIHCVQGSYPDWLQDLWHDYDESKGSENDSPEIFQENQLFIVLELKDGGKDLESFLFTSADQGLAAFRQIALALAVGEEALCFEHRDLHWGNVLLSSTKDKQVQFLLDGEAVCTATKGIKVSIIDFTLSRINDPTSGKSIYYDLSKDGTLFTAEGDYQFEIYRMMKEFNGNQWDTFTPKSNIAWLHYLLDKLCTMARYKNRSSKVHNRAIDILSEMKDNILIFDSAASFVKSNAFL